MEWRRPIAKLDYDEYSWSTEKFHTPAILSGCGGFFALRACHRPLARTVEPNFFQFFCAALPPDTPKKNPGPRDLSTVKISASYDPWRLKKRRKTETKKIEKIGLGNQFFAFFAWIWRSYGSGDVKISFLVKFCSRCTYYQLCTTLRAHFMT